MSYISILNGQFVQDKKSKISTADRGYTLGDGLFETMVIHKGQPPFFSYHWTRLERSAKLLSIPLPFTRHALSTMIEKLVKVNAVTSGGLRLTLSAGESSRGLLTPCASPNYVIHLFSLSTYTTNTFTATFVKTRRNEWSLAAQIKSTSYLDNIFAAREAALKGFDEAFLLNSQGNLAEAASSTIFVVKKNEIYTPPLSDGALPGVLRAILINEFKKISITEKSVVQDEVYAADEIFVTNALRGVRSIVQVDGYRISSVEKAMHFKNALQSRYFT